MSRANSQSIQYLKFLELVVERLLIICLQKMLQLYKGDISSKTWGILSSHRSIHTIETQPNNYKVNYNMLTN